MLIYNTYSRQKEEFVPLDPPNVTMYMCGPTVYDYFHIGNGRSFIMADIIRRYLSYKGYNVKFVMNLTDIDDKIIKKSIEENKDFNLVSNFYISAFFDDLKKLKVSEASFYPKATEHITEMIDLISTLESKDIAYQIDGNVYYDVKKFSDYGKLSGKNLEELESGSRVEINEQKRNPLDFVLWKKAKEGEPSWDSPWGKGRPGWHIECSAMSCKHLGQSIDIHAGGNDLIFPHHENEIAQSEAVSHNKFVKYWIHFGFLNIQNEKMSKSLGNFFTTREILKKFSAESIRLFFLQTYYRGPLNFSEELLQSAQKGFEKIENLAQRIINAYSEEGIEVNYPENFNISGYYSDFEKAMEDDFNTSQAVAVIFDFIRDVNKILSLEGKKNITFLDDVKSFLTKTAQEVFGIIHFDQLDEKEKDSNLEDDLIKLLITLRENYKKEKNYAASDHIRNELLNLGIILQDAKTGTTYQRK
jgi:cysteinyl-tRNA synthetase